MQNALQIAARGYEGSVKRFSEALEARTHVVTTAQELILTQVFDGYSPEEQRLIGALSLVDISLKQDEATTILRSAFDCSEASIAALFRKLRITGALQVFGVDRFKVHDAMRLLGRAHLESLGDETGRKARSAIRDLLITSLPRDWEMQKVFLLLRMFVALDNIKPLVELATDELFHEMGYMPEIVAYLEKAAASDATPAEDRFWALDGLVFGEFKHGDDKRIADRLTLMERLVAENDLGASERLAIGMKRMIYEAREGNARSVAAAMEEIMRALPDRPEFVRIARYNFAHALFELGHFDDCIEQTDELIREYYAVLGLKLEDVVRKNPDEIAPLLKKGENHTNDLKHLADTLDLQVKALKRAGRLSTLQGMHAMKFYGMAQALDSFVRVAQDVVDDFISRHDYVGARDVIERNLLPTVLRMKLAGKIIPVRSQYAVVLAYCGAIAEAEAEMARLAPYESGLTQEGQTELRRQRALIGRLKLHPPPPQWQFRLPPGKYKVNAPCPCGSGKKYKRCHGKRA